MRENEKGKDHVLQAYVYFLVSEILCLFISMTLYGPQSKSMICQVWKITFWNFMTFQVFHDLYKPSNCEQIAYQKRRGFFLAWLCCSESIHVCKAHMCQNFTNIRQLRPRILSVVYMYLDLRAIIYSTQINWKSYIKEKIHKSFVLLIVF